MRAFIRTQITKSDFH